MPTAVVVIKVFCKTGFRDLLIFFLGLNLAWMETAVNAIIVGGADNLLGWLPFNWYLTALEWFWIHFALTGITVAALLYTENLWSNPLRNVESRRR
jgi:hypothetical protein